MAHIGRAHGVASLLGALVLCAWWGAGAALASAPSYPAAAPIAAYRMASQADEIALARSAAPPAIGDAAEIMTLGAAGYAIAAKGTNGFVCLVERSWANEPDNAEFWNPKVRGPLCFNPAAVRSVMPTYLQRTTWVLAGASKDEIGRRTKAAIASGQIRAPENGAMSFMLSKGSYLGDQAVGGHWHPHLMFFVPRDAQGRTPDWGEDVPGSPVISGGPGIDTAALYFVPVSKWSDGGMAVMGAK